MTSQEAFMSCRSFFFRELVEEYNAPKIPMKVFRLYWQLASNRATAWVNDNKILIADNSLRIM